MSPRATLAPTDTQLDPTAALLAGQPGEQRGWIFNIQRCSVQDGPGIRSTVFLKGCPLCCAWCHNPEGQAPQPELIVLDTRCIACGQCRNACAFGQAWDAAQPPRPPAENCALCGECVAVCPTGARQLIGEHRSVASVVAAVEPDRIFYDESGGGVTFSGGEPLLQPDFLKALLEACRARGLRTAVDTCGFACTETLLAVAQRADLILFDVKLMEEAKHRQYTGVSNGPILENLRALDRVHKDLWLRVPLIPGINDDAANLDAVARLALGLTGLRQISLLPYHRAGALKFPRLGQACALADLEPPSASAVERAAAHLRAFGLEVRTGR